MSIFEDTMDHFAANNPLTDVNIYYKVLFALVTMIINLFAQSPIIPTIVFMFISYLVLFKAEIIKSFYAKFMSVPFIFGFISFVFMAFFIGTGPHIFELGIFGWGVTVDGFNRGILVLAKTMGGFSCLAFLVLTTPMNRLFGICSDIKIPQIVTDLAILMYRYIFLFFDVTLNIYHSQRTRLGYQGYMNSFKCLGTLAGMVFIRTWEQGEGAYDALASRGYDGEIKLLGHHDSVRDISNVQITLLVVFEALVIIGTIATGTINIL